MNINKEQEQFKLFSRYNVGKTLNENISLNEAGLRSIAGTDIELLRNVIRNAFRDIRDVKNVKLIDPTTNVVKRAESADEIVDALKTGKYTKNTIGQVYSGLLKSAETPETVINGIINNKAFDDAIRVHYKPTVRDIPAFEAQLLQKYPKATTDKIIQRIFPEYKATKVPRAKATPKTKVGGAEAGVEAGAGTGAGAEAGAGVGAGVVNTTVTKMSQAAAGKWSKVLKGLKRKALIGLGIGTAVVVGGSIVAGKSIFGGYTTPEDEAEAGSAKPPFPKCVNDLLDQQGTSVGLTTGGDPVIIVPKTGVPENDAKGGVMFFTNNRVFTGDKSKRGTWSCNGVNVVKEDKSTLVTIFNGLLNEQEISEDVMQSYIDSATDDLNPIVTTAKLTHLKSLLIGLQGKTINGKPAIKSFVEYYNARRWGMLHDFVKDVNSVGTITLGKIGDDLKAQIIDISQGKTIPTQGGGGTGANTDIGAVTIKWDVATTPDPGKNKPRKSIYHDCTEFPFVKGCRNAAIKEIQTCLKFPTKYQTGNFGPITEKGLTDNGYSITAGLTREIYDAIKAKCGQNENPATPAHIPGSEFQDTPIPPSNIPDINTMNNRTAELPIA